MTTNLERKSPTIKKGVKIKDLEKAKLKGRYIVLIISAGV
jgi:hypothetical protein